MLPELLFLVPRDGTLSPGSVRSLVDLLVGTVAATRVTVDQMTP